MTTTTTTSPEPRQPGWGLSEPHLDRGFVRRGCVSSATRLRRCALWMVCLVAMFSTGAISGPAVAEPFAAKSPVKPPAKSPAKTSPSGKSSTPKKLSGKTARAQQQKAQVSVGSVRNKRIRRDKIRRQRALSAKEVAEARTSSRKAAAALAKATSSVRRASLEYDRARRSQKRAVSDLRSARADEARLTKQLSRLRARQRDAAMLVLSVGLVGTADTFLASESVSEGSRVSELGSIGRQRSADVIDEMVAVNEDLTLARKLAQDAEDRATRYREDVADRLAEYEAIKKQRETLADSAEAQLEQQLAEFEGLAALDRSISSQYEADIRALERQFASAGIGGRGKGTLAGDVAGGKIPGLSVRTGARGNDTHGIVVASSIRSNLVRLLADAKRDGIYFTGGGYRSSASQISLRRSHCGSSTFAIYHMRASHCRPPTARPGFSQHERGLAIDFAQNGRGLHRGSSGYQWLRQNAWKYGFKNLPSEPWHWSTTGR